jgi:hypothetical protein
VSNIFSMFIFLFIKRGKNDSLEDQENHQVRHAYAASVYAVIALTTWINLLQYIRLYETFRFFIDMTKSVFISGKTWKFFVVFFVMLMAVSSSMFLLYLKKADVWGDAYVRNGVVIDGDDILMLFKDFVFTSFGDFGFSEELQDDYVQYFIFAFAIIFLCLIMLNMLIGILSDVMAKVLET